MNTVEKIISIPEAGRTIEGLRDTGYSFETAIADLIDNSIAAKATIVDVKIRMDYEGEIQISIADDGCGMDREGLIEAMRYGSPKRKDPASLGKFGLGLKTASTAFCRQLSLISKPSINHSPLMATWDLDHVVNVGEWSLQMSSEPSDDALSHLAEIAPKSSGTVVLLNKVDRLLREYSNPGGGHAKKSLERKLTSLKNHLAMTFQRFIDTKFGQAPNIRIVLNGELISAWDPFQQHMSELVASDEVDVENADAKFFVRAYILPRREDIDDEQQLKEANISSGMQGLYIYREQRLIHSTGWLGMYQIEPHLTLLRVEFSFDHKLDDAFHLDIKKSRIELNDDLWKWLKDQFLPSPRRVANKRYRTGVNENIQKKKKDVHNSSNTNIRNKEDEVGGATIKICDPKTGEVEINNKVGTFTRILTISPAAKEGEVNVQPTDGIDDGLLFEPALIQQHKAVRINTHHPYYHKVYVPNFNRSVTIQGIDSLLWALCVAELTVTSDKTAESFLDMRYEVTRILRKLVDNLPEPDLDEE